MRYLLLSAIAISIIGTMMIPNAFAEEEEKIVVLETRSGVLVIQFFPEDAPNTVDNFVELVESGYYDRTLFHRVINGFMIQGGDPNTKLNPDEDLDYDQEVVFSLRWIQAVGEQVDLVIIYQQSLTLLNMIVVLYQWPDLLIRTVLAHNFSSCIRIQTFLMENILYLVE